MMIMVTRILRRTLNPLMTKKYRRHVRSFWLELPRIETTESFLHIFTPRGIVFVPGFSTVD